MTQAQAVPMAESRNEQVNVRLTPQEKLDVQLLKAMGIRPTESDVLRDFTIADVRAEAERMRDAARERAPRLQLGVTE